jgi:hypothetical protein
MLYWCYLLPEDGRLLLGRVRARTPWALNLARAWESLVSLSLSGQPVALA